MGGRVDPETQQAEEHDPEDAPPLAAVGDRHEERGRAEGGGVPEDGMVQEGLGGQENEIMPGIARPPPARGSRPAGGQD